MAAATLRTRPAALLISFPGGCWGRLQRRRRRARPLGVPTARAADRPGRSARHRHQDAAVALERAPAVARRPADSSAACQGRNAASGVPFRAGQSNAGIVVQMRIGLRPARPRAFRDRRWRWVMVTPLPRSGQFPRVGAGRPRRVSAVVSRSDSSRHAVGSEATRPSRSGWLRRTARSAIASPPSATLTASVRLLRMDS